MDSLALLEQWQAEHESNDLELLKLAREKETLARALQEQQTKTQQLHAEIRSIKEKGASSAGRTEQLKLLVEQEEAEGRLLDAEITRLTDETQHSLTALEDLRQTAATEHLRLAAALPKQRDEYHERNTQSMAQAKRLCTHLRVLEREACAEHGS